MPNESTFLVSGGRPKPSTVKIIAVSMVQFAFGERELNMTQKQQRLEQNCRRIERFPPQPKNLRERKKGSHPTKRNLIPKRRILLCFI